MPFDFKNFKSYTINYDKLFNEVNKNNIFNDKNIQIQYLNRWIDVLKEHDKIIVNQLNTANDILKYTILTRDEPEIFQLPIHWSNNTILLHFRISIANSVIENYLSQSELFPLEEFTSEDSSIYWTPVDGNVERYSKANKPILIIPYLNGRYGHLVIDGNHRLTYKKNNNCNNIPALIISEKSVIEHSLFSSSFDSMYYIFNNELNHFGSETASGNFNAMHLIQKSFLMGNGYLF